MVTNHPPPYGVAMNYEFLHSERHFSGPNISRPGQEGISRLVLLTVLAAIAPGWKYLPTVSQ